MCRKIDFEGIENCRDLGGIQCVGGKRIKKGLLFRSASLSGASEKDIRVLTETYRLSRIIDLRTDAERLQKPDPVIDGVEYLALPIFDEATAGITREDGSQAKLALPDMAELYRTMVTAKACREAFREVLIRIFSHDFEQGSILWHCTAGKDRCGLTSALVLAALGVSKEDIMEDYLLTNETCRNEAERIHRYVLSTGRAEAEAAAVREVFLAKRAYLDAALDAVREQSGSTYDFLLKGLHISEEMIARFRNELLG